MLWLLNANFMLHGVCSIVDKACRIVFAHTSWGGPASIFNEARITWDELSHTTALHANTQYEN